MKRMDNIVILANGLFPGTRQCLDVLKSAGKVICCDGAADKLLDAGLTPDAIVGDMDSVSERIRNQHAAIMVRSNDQDSNDLTKAVHYCIENEYPSVVILGATGLREDHTLGNISLMLEYSPRIHVRIMSDYGIFSLLRSGEKVKSYPGEKISVFSIDNTVSITSIGLKYSLNNLQLSSWYTATLNESVSDTFSLVFNSTQPLILYRAW